MQTDPSNALPVFYLIDSITKNLGGVYLRRFEQNILTIFACIYDAGDAKMRNSVEHVRRTWDGLFPPALLLKIDAHIRKRKAEQPGFAPATAAAGAWAELFSAEPPRPTGATNR